jgi:hypothetical protein
MGMNSNASKMAKSKIKRALRQAAREGIDGMTRHQLAEACERTNDWVDIYAPMFSEALLVPRHHDDGNHWHRSKQRVAVFRLHRFELLKLIAEGGME